MHCRAVDGLAIRLLNVLDDFNREGLGIEVDFSLPTERVIPIVGKNGLPDRFLRAACPKRSPWRCAQFDTLRLNLVKLAANIVGKKTRIIVTLPASCPRQGPLRLLYHALAPPEPA